MFLSRIKRNFSVFLLCRQGGDADTNGAVAGALLGCKLGTSALPPSWLNELKHKDWLDYHINRFDWFEVISIFNFLRVLYFLTFVDDLSHPHAQKCFWKASCYIRVHFKILRSC